MNEFVVLNLVLRKVVPVVATGLDRTFRLVGRVQRSSKPEKNDLTGAGGVSQRKHRLFHRLRCISRQSI